MCCELNRHPRAGRGRSLPAVALRSCAHAPSCLHYAQEAVAGVGGDLHHITVFTGYDVGLRDSQRQFIVNHGCVDRLVACNDCKFVCGTRGMFGDRQVDDSAAVVGEQHDK
jgi:hypothetical protein